MIITECPHCDVPQMYTVQMGEFGVFALEECSECAGEYVIEVTMTAGTTYPRAEFESDVLPEIDGFERCEHPDGEDVLYCNPDKLMWAE